MSNTTWQDTLSKSAQLFERSGKARKQASGLLWQGAQEGIESWVPGSGKDSGAEEFRANLLEIMGSNRKGDVSKIVTVALAVRNNGLLLEQFDNLAKAYAEARRLTVIKIKEADEDEAAEAAVAAIDAPKTSSQPEGAAKIVLSKGVDEAARLLIDALGAENHAAHRSFLRAVSQEIAGRVKPEPKPEKKVAAKGNAKVAKKTTAKPEVKTAGTKAKPVAKKATAAKAKPVARKKAAPEPEPVEDDDLFEEFDELEDEPETVEDDMFAELEDEDTDEVDETPAPKKAAPTKAKPVVRRRPKR